MFGHSNLKLIPRRCTKSGKVPSKSDPLEVCLNLADGLVWIGDCHGEPILLTELTNSPRIFDEDFLETIIPKSVSRS
jgi:hypothetical protein